MKREIKFRAWDGKTKQIVGEYELYDIYIMEGTWGDMGFSFNDLIFSQFTGLKDKNGKEIYEGDIGRVEHYGNKEIKFEKGGFYFGSGTPMANFVNWSDKIEIIGNIYENPELLTPSSRQDGE